jgi:hypothetical protein
VFSPDGGVGAVSFGISEAVLLITLGVAALLIIWAVVRRGGSTCREMCCSNGCEGPVMRLLPHETEIHGQWIYGDGPPRADSNCERVTFLTARVLVRVGVTDDGWETLYRDPSDNRLWERTYLQSELHGGGPPTLRHLRDDEARTKYPSAFR